MASTKTLARKPVAVSEAHSQFLEDVWAGLSAHPKRLKPKYFYDEPGSHLFEEITYQPEYYPTRTELGILEERGDDIAALLPDHAALIEFGAGATRKIRLLLDHAKIAAYVPVDISGDFIAAQAHELAQDFPSLAIHPVAADFTAIFELPREIDGLPRVGFFPGSTIGNFEPHEASDFLRRARGILGPGAMFIIGADLDKDPAVLHAAYNDKEGVTASFNLNLLRRMNDELDADFDLSAFVHRAIYNREKRRVEMHLVSMQAQTVHVGGRSFHFRMGESIHTESSHKFTVEQLQTMARGAGFTPKAVFTDAEKLFSVHVWEAAAPKAVGPEAAE